MDPNSSDGQNPATESSANTETVATGGNSSSTASPSAENKDVKSSESLLDRFNSVMKKSDDGKSSNPQGSEAVKTEGQEGQPADGAQAPKTEPDKELGDDVTDEELNGYKPSTAKRIKQLVTQRNEARDQLKAAEPVIRSFQQIQRFVQDAGLDKDEVNTGFEIMKQIKQNPEKALEMLRPYVEGLLTVTGSILPPDLKQRVEMGEISEAAAQELSRARAQNTFFQQSTQRQSEMTVVRQRQQLANDAGAAVTDWDKTWSQTDPDYKRKQPYVMREIERRLLKGELPKSAQEAVTMCNAIKAEVEKDLATFIPQKTEIKANVGGTQPSNMPAPKTMLEAMEQGLRKAGKS